jgi:hypothetical protein
MRPRYLLAAAAVAAAATGASAQQQAAVASTGYEPSYRPGWTLTPSFGVSQTYDDNISLFAVRTAEESNNDLVSSYFPGADLHYSGPHTTVGAAYTGSFLAYRTFNVLNSWDQRGRVYARRQESERLKWAATANAAKVPTTDAVDLGGIPYRRTGATMADARGGLDYRLDPRNDLTASIGYQSVRFDRPEVPGGFLQGGHALDAIAGWRHHLNGRLGVGADYAWRRAIAIDQEEAFAIHSMEGAVDYQLSPTWSIAASAGVVVLQQNALTEGKTGPGWRVAAERHRANTTLNGWYLRSYVPSFAFGGTITSQELGFGMHAPLFRSRYWFTEQSAVFRDDRPLTDLLNQLPLRSLRTNSVIGWAPVPWARVEGYYSRTQQSSLRFGGQVYRNRIGIQLVTSKPLRIQ